MIKMRLLILIVTLALAVNGLPADPNALEDIKANISAIWTELSELKEVVQNHVGGSSADIAPHNHSKDHQFFSQHETVFSEPHGHHHHHGNQHGHHHHEELHQGHQHHHHEELHQGHQHQHFEDHHQSQTDPDNGSQVQVDDTNESIEEIDDSQEVQEEESSHSHGHQHMDEFSHHGQLHSSHHSSGEIQGQSAQETSQSGHHGYHHPHQHHQGGNHYHSHWDGHHLGHYHGRHNHHNHQVEEPLEASCIMQPNAEMPDSQVMGNIIITQDAGFTGPLKFRIFLSKFPTTNQHKTHGFHIHMNSVVDNKCSTAGSHFNPEGVNHAGPEDEIRHVGDLGNVEVDSSGNILGHTIIDDKAQFRGTASIIGKSIVVHELEDDLGRGGDAGSLATGNAGKRLACCNITSINIPTTMHAQEPRIRFNG